MEIVEVNCETGETVIRQATKTELDFRKHLAEKAAEMAALEE